MRGAGKANFEANKNGNGVALLIHLQGRSIEPQTFRMSNFILKVFFFNYFDLNQLIFFKYKGEKPKNHVAANTVKIKQLMRKVREREAQKEKQTQEKNLPVKALWKSDKYKDVQSKLKEILLVSLFVIVKE